MAEGLGSRARSQTVPISLGSINNGSKKRENLLSESTLSDSFMEDPENYCQNLDEEMIRKKEALAEKDTPIHILVIGVTGTGKSTLINSMIGNTPASAKHGPQSVQSQVEVHKGVHDEIEIQVYDTTGFSDSGGKSEEEIVQEISSVIFVYTCICGVLQCNTVLCEIIIVNHFKCYFNAIHL